MRTAEAPVWPRKTRDIHNHHMDSTVWDRFQFRDDDVVIASWGKSGTTWMQQIVGQLIFNGAENVDTSELSPWIDLRVLPPEALASVDQQKHRRFVKTHLPVDALVFSPTAKYLYVGRDGRDVLCSMFNHHLNANDAWYQALNETPGLVGPPIARPPASIRDYYRQWFDGDGYPFWPMWENIRSWWAARELPNVKLVHFEDLKRDLAKSIREIRDFLGVDHGNENFSAIVEHCTFDYMKAHAERMAPVGGVFWEGGAKTFINKGTNGRWREFLTPDEAAEYEARALRELGPECAAWLANGSRV
jgi:aryl sulfotransferase